jgi:hypothetical protein
MTPSSLANIMVLDKLATIILYYKPPFAVRGYLSEASTHLAGVYAIELSISKGFWVGHGAV